MSFNSLVKKEIEQCLKRSVPDTELAELFLSCGFISDPLKEYRIEFHTIKHTPTQNLINKLFKMGIVTHKVVRAGRMLVCITASEHIEDILTMMGAQHSALDMMNIKIEKDVHNKANRIANCEIANADRIAKTNSVLILAVEQLKSSGVNLPYQLEEAADFLLLHPEMSTAEMAKGLNISKSGLYHRMQKIKSMAQDITKRKDK